MVWFLIELHMHKLSCYWFSNWDVRQGKIKELFRHFVQVQYGSYPLWGMTTNTQTKTGHPSVGLLIFQLLETCSAVKLSCFDIYPHYFSLHLSNDYHLIKISFRVEDKQLVSFFRFILVIPFSIHVQMRTAIFGSWRWFVWNKLGWKFLFLERIAFEMDFKKLVTIGRNRTTSTISLS